LTLEGGRITHPLPPPPPPPFRENDPLFFFFVDAPSNTRPFLLSAFFFHCLSGEATIALVCFVLPPSGGRGLRIAVSVFWLFTPAPPHLFGKVFLFFSRFFLQQVFSADYRPFPLPPGFFFFFSKRGDLIPVLSSLMGLLKHSIGLAVVSPRPAVCFFHTPFRGA